MHVNWTAISHHRRKDIGYCNARQVKQDESSPRFSIPAMNFLFGAHVGIERCIVGKTFHSGLDGCSEIAFGLGSDEMSIGRKTGLEQNSQDSEMRILFPVR